MPKQEITIVWKTSPLAKTAGYEDASLTFPLYTAELTSDTEILEVLFRQTNLYEGHLWDAIEANLPTNRNHTALSVGDEVRIDGVWYRCEDLGWASFTKEKTAEEIALEDAYEEAFLAGWKACVEALNNTPRPTLVR